jgi:hypothetical protein
MRGKLTIWHWLLRSVCLIYYSDEVFRNISSWAAGLFNVGVILVGWDRQFIRLSTSCEHDWYLHKTAGPLKCHMAHVFLMTYLQWCCAGWLYSSPSRFFSLGETTVLALCKLLPMSTMNVVNNCFYPVFDIIPTNLIKYQHYLMKNVPLSSILQMLISGIWMLLLMFCCSWQKWINGSFSHWPAIPL